MARRAPHCDTLLRKAAGDGEESRRADTQRPGAEEPPSVAGGGGHAVARRRRDPACLGHDPFGRPGKSAAVRPVCE
ncbi:hypothetical protein [Halobellus rarus]|uniref:Uncharacterized protein n=1 Tax=Halobellus rarus TaxID=1126237 RepID=A0ABD6CJJ0_9EURY|nr:hypothetical protein [Halobellus rarus]